MPDTTTPAPATGATTVLEAPAGTGPDTPVAGDALVDEETIVEEISIDGMCGVY